MKPRLVRWKCPPLSTLGPDARAGGDRRALGRGERGGGGGAQVAQAQVQFTVSRFFLPVLRASVPPLAMALSRLSGDEQGILFVQLCNVLDPGIAVALASVSNELRMATLAPR